MELRIAFAVLLIGFAYGDTNYRLKTPIIPSNYKISLTPYFDTNDTRAFTFDGEVTITFSTSAPTNQIKFHSNGLNYTIKDITLSPRIALDATNPLEFNTTYDFAFINLQSELQVNVAYTLKIVYTGEIREELYGFYRSSYMEGGIKKWLGATQMEPTHARKVFPCFDEPGLKATFDLVISRPASYKPSLSNMKIQATENLANGMVKETFYTTPIMPTYLVAFVISEFDGVSNSDGSFGVYTRPEAVNQTGFAFDFGQRVVDALGRYFSIDYYSSNEHLKLDHVTVPDFGAGAMENWGLVTYRESLLLYVPEESMPYFKYRVAQIMAHETTHMWFGDLVTCHWWSDTWLNEGFATYFQDYITAVIEPDLGSEDILVTGSLYDAYDSDCSQTSPPISNPNVNSPSEISDHFGAITYKKGGSVIRMMHHLIGDVPFVFGLNAYLNSSRFDSGYPERLYEALDAGVSIVDSLASYPGASVRELMSSWITQAGHPILTVNVDYETQTVTLSQNRFYENSSLSSNEIYKIPITYTTNISPNFNNTKPALIMDSKTKNISLNGSLNEDSWLIFNVQETGLYRVNYDDSLWRKIAAALKGEDRSSIHHLNRAKIVNDLFAFYFADVEEFARVHEILQFMKNEDDFSVWFAALRGLNKMKNRFWNIEVWEAVEEYALGLMSNMIEKIGYMPRADDSFKTLRNRQQLLEFACRAGHQSCVDHAVEMFRGFRHNGTDVPASLKSVVYCTGLRFGDASDVDFLKQRMLTTNVANEVNVIIDALGCSSDIDKLMELLLSEDTPIRLQDQSTLLSSILSNGSHATAVLDRIDCSEWDDLYPSMENVLNMIASSLRSEEDIETLEGILNSGDCDAAAVDSARSTLEKAKATVAWAQAKEQELLNTVRNHADTAVPTITILALVVGAVIISY